MADPISLASGLLALATFAFQSSLTLHNTIKSFQTHNKRVRDLTDELQALSDVLAPLSETLSARNALDLSSLDLPLLRCGNACKEFQQELLKCSSQSGGSGTSFREWAKLRYMGDDIDGFRRLLAGYKLTIIIALTNANLNKSAVTADSIESYKDLLETATGDLQDHLESINEKLEMVLKRTVTGTTSADSDEVKLIEEERLSTQRCLQICDRLSEHLSQIQIPPGRSPNAAGAVDPNTTPEGLINEGLQEFRTNLTATTTKLENHMKKLMERLMTKSKTGIVSGDDITDLARLQEEWETARQCINICYKADNHLKENVSVIDNYATGDALQFMVSTNGKILHGKNRGLGWRTRQVGGYLNDASVVQLSRDMSRVGYNFAEIGISDPPSKSLPGHEDSVERHPVSDTWDRHGRGIKLEAKHTPEPARSSSASAKKG